MKTRSRGRKRPRKKRRKTITVKIKRKKTRSRPRKRPRKKEKKLSFFLGHFLGQVLVFFLKIPTSDLQGYVKFGLFKDALPNGKALDACNVLYLYKGAGCWQSIVPFQE